MEYTIPKSWSEISIKQYDELLFNNSIENDKERQEYNISVFLDLDIDDVRRLKMSEMSKILNLLEWSNNPPSKHFNKIITIGNRKFGFIPNLEEITLGEWWDADSFCSEWDQSKHKLASILYRPIIKEDENGYEIEEYNSKYSDFLYRNMSIQDLNGASLFFSLIVTELLVNSGQSLMEN